MCLSASVALVASFLQCTLSYDISLPNNNSNVVIIIAPFGFSPWMMHPNGLLFRATSLLTKNPRINVEVFVAEFTSAACGHVSAGPLLFWGISQLLFLCNKVLVQGSFPSSTVSCKNLPGVGVNPRAYTVSLSCRHLWSAGGGDLLFSPLVSVLHIGGV